jgi:hypothetical protein
VLELDPFKVIVLLSIASAVVLSELHDPPYVRVPD